MVSVFQSFLSEDAVEEKEDQARTQTFQGDNWKIDHATGLTANKESVVENLGRQRESVNLPGASGTRPDGEGVIPVQVEEHDGKKLAMQNSQQGTFAQVMLGNSVRQQDDERETVAQVDTKLEQEIKDRAPIVSAIAAQGNTTQIQAMLSGLPGAGSVAVQTGGPQVSTGTPGIPGAAMPQTNNKLTLSV